MTKAHTNGRLGEKGGGVSEYGKHGLARMKQTQIHAGRWSGMPGDDEAKGL
jgi:hypothetical protein